MPSKQLAATNKLLRAYPWTSKPLIVLAPMRPVSGPHLAVAVSRAGGLGFINPNGTHQGIIDDFEDVKKLLEAQDTSSDALSKFASGGLLPVGIGFIVWRDDKQVALSTVEKYRPVAVWLFAPRTGQEELDEWISELRNVSPQTQIWIQVGTLGEATAAANSSSPPDVLVIQGTEAGGHGRTSDGLSIVTLFPEVANAIRGSGIPLIATGGIADGRGVAAALSLGAAGVALGTRFIAATEARVKKGYQRAVLDAKDGAKSTVRTTIYNQLRGTNWPEQYSPRGVTNRTWDDFQAKVPYEELKKAFDESTKAGDEGWGIEGRQPTYAGAGVGLVDTVADAETIVNNLRKDAISIAKAVAESFE